MERGKRRKIVRRVLLGFVLLLTVFVAGNLLISKYGLETTYYEISSSQLTDSFRIVQLSDQHGTVFGKENERLLKKVEEASPDLILITGDIINNKSSDMEYEYEHATALIRKLTEIAPVYFSYGNHEAGFDLRDEMGNEEANNSGVMIRTLFETAGATVLDRDWVDIEVNGQAIRLGGIYGYCQIPPYAAETKRTEESDYVIAFQDTTRYSILMCHMPVAWLGGSLYGYEVDCVFAGHAHGGQVRIPWIGGLWAPDQGWFPGEECGVYTTSEENWKKVRKKIKDWMDKTNADSSWNPMEQEYSQSYLVLSRGLGNTEKIPRFNNIPEIVVTDFVPTDFVPDTEK